MRREAEGMVKALEWEFAVTVTGLGGLACLANTQSDVERGTVFHHLQNVHVTVKRCKLSADISVVPIHFSWMLQGH